MKKNKKLWSKQLNKRGEKINFVADRKKKINQTDFVWKSGSSNLLVNKIKFIVSLRILVLSVMSNDVLPKSNVCVKTEPVFSSNL